MSLQLSRLFGPGVCKHPTQGAQGRQGCWAGGSEKGLVFAACHCEDCLHLRRAYMIDLDFTKKYKAEQSTNTLLSENTIVDTNKESKMEG